MNVQDKQIPVFVKMPAELATAIALYLGDRPFKEVAGLVPALSRAVAIGESDALKTHMAEIGQDAVEVHLKTAERMAQAKHAAQVADNAKAEAEADRLITKDQQRHPE